MPIPATVPTEIQVTYDKWTLASFVTRGDGCAAFGDSDVQVVQAIATLAKARIRDDGTWERSPIATDYRTIQVNDLYALAAQKPVVASALAALVAAVQEIASEQGAL